MRFTRAQAQIVYNKLKSRNPKVNWKKIPFDQFAIGINVELEHGLKYARYGTNVTNDDPIMTGKIALIHIIEVEDYYTKLKKYVDPN
jgi:hypothetical protein